MKPLTVKCDRCGRHDVALKDAVFAAELIPSGKIKLQPGEIVVCRQCIEKERADAIKP